MSNQQEANQITSNAAAQMREKNHSQGTTGFDYDILHRHIASALDARDAEIAKLGQALHTTVVERDALEALLAHVERALEPFALIGLDVLKEHPGWANHVFSGDWCGYRLTYVQFETAAAVSIKLAKLKAAMQLGEQK